ncbi:hypothetical protein, partial [Streptomyces europaeiscabiei]|uniref:hypothetical protein n=1 Tax=Streptomyces europaeiscabiei TaxID=146819 RepID=UPI001968D322
GDAALELGERLGVARRVLREQRTGRPTSTASSRSDDERTPELVRDRMAAYRDGWVRGGGRAPGSGVTHGPATGSDSSEGDPA